MCPAKQQPAQEPEIVVNHRIDGRASTADCISQRAKSIPELHERSTNMKYRLLGKSGLRVTMRASAAEYRRLHLRAHELLGDVPLYDVSFVDLPGGGSGRTVADIHAYCNKDLCRPALGYPDPNNGEPTTRGRSDILEWKKFC
jgi:hypothetical protein